MRRRRIATLALLSCSLAGCFANRGEVEVGPDAALPIEPDVELGAPPNGNCGVGSVVGHEFGIARPPGDSSTFGTAVAVDGDHFVLGAPGGTSAEGRTGLVRVYGVGATEPQVLVAGDAAEGDQFGAAVALQGDTLVVGAHGDGDGALYTGSVYVFRQIDGVWVEVQKLIASDSQVLSSFGISVALDEDATTLVIGASDVDRWSGRAYVFQRRTGRFEEEAILEANDRQANDVFGASVTVDRKGERVAIGAKRQGAGSGAVYLFDRRGGEWTGGEKIVAVDASDGDWFGQAVALGDDVVLVGAPYDASLETPAVGSVYVIEKEGGAWVQRFKLRPPARRANAGFGSQLAISSDGRMVVRSAGDRSEGVRSEAYVFDRCVDGRWFAYPLESTGVPVLDRVKRSVAIAGDRVVVGSGGNRHSDRETVYVFSLADGKVLAP